ncbi:MAG: RNA polymerase sigma factor [Bacteroidetes bacterium]|nr:RNA polymerase sigma factor [Bacteroidota bacterium]
MTQQEYNTCVDLHSNALYRFAMKQLRDRDESSEIVQISFEKLWLKHRDVDFLKAKSYLFTTAYRAMMDFWRKAKRSTELTPELENRDFAGDSSYRGLKEILDRALQSLPEIQRSVLLLRDYEGYSYEEIGEMTSLNESQVKVYIFRARQKMKSLIGSLESVL